MRSGYKTSNVSVLTVRGKGCQNLDSSKSEVFIFLRVVHRGSLTNNCTFILLIATRHGEAVPSGLLLLRN